MKVLVTGSNGFIGRALVQRLMTEPDVTVRALVRPGSSHEILKTLQQTYGPERLEIFRGALTNAREIAPALNGIETVYHLAAGMNGAPADLFQNTVVASKRLLEALVSCRPLPKVVLVSSMAVYGIAHLRWRKMLTEDASLETQPQQRDLYAYAKLRQEQLFRSYQTQHQFPLVVLRPGVVYGPGGPALPRRIGLPIMGLFFHLGGNNLLPLSFVDNCADAICVAGKTPQAVGETFNVLDDELVTCKYYLKQYKKNVAPLRSITLPYALTSLLSHCIQRYHVYSQGQLPAFLTPYKTANAWKGMRFSNQKLKSLGWQPVVPAKLGLSLTFRHLRSMQGRPGMA